MEPTGSTQGSASTCSKWEAFPPRLCSRPGQVPVSRPQTGHGTCRERGSPGQARGESGRFHHAPSPGRRPCACLPCGASSRIRAAPDANQSECKAEWPGELWRPACSCTGSGPLLHPAWRPVAWLQWPVPGVLSSQSAQCSCGARLPTARPPWWGSHPGGGRRGLRSTGVPGSATGGLCSVLRSRPLTLPCPWDQPAGRSPALTITCSGGHQPDPSPPLGRHSWACIAGRRRVQPKAWQGPRISRRLPRTVRLNSLDAPISPRFLLLLPSSLQVIRSHRQVWLSG